MSTGVMKGYPVFLVGLENKRCVVVGGSREAERKAEGLLACDAQVAVIGARVTSRLREWADAGRIEWIARDFRPGDVEGAYLVIAENADPAISAQVWEEAQGRLVNIMDDVERCNFIAGSVVQQGPLTIAISTNGCAPALAVRLRERMREEFGPEYAAFLELMRELREPLARRFPDFQQRRAVWYALVDSDILDLFRAGEPERAMDRAAKIVGFEVASRGAAGR